MIRVITKLQVECYGEIIARIKVDHSEPDEPFYIEMIGTVYRSQQQWNTLQSAIAQAKRIYKAGVPS